MSTSPSLPPAHASASLRRVLGPLGLAAAIVNITVGGGIFRLPANVAGSLGAAAPLAYLVCAIAMGLIVLCIADAGSRVSLTGGPYAYIGVALGPYAGFVAGVLLWMLGIFATAAVSTVFATSIGQLAPAFAGHTSQVVVLVLTYAFWTVVNVQGVGLGARLNSAATVAKLVPLLLVAVGGLFHVRAEHVAIAVWPATADVARMSLLLVFAFAGVETALVPSGEVRDTARTVPLGIALAMGGITVLYIALQVASQGILGPALPTSSTPLADAAGQAFGDGARALLLAGAAISMFGYLGGMTLSVPRIVFALAGDGYLPRVLSRVHPTHRTPHLAIAAQSTVTLAFAISGTFEGLAILANVAALMLYLGCAVAAWRLHASGLTADGVGVRLPFAHVAPWLAVPVIGWLLTGVTRTEWTGFVACVVIASLLYLLPRGQRPAAAAAAAQTACPNDNPPSFGGTT